MAGDSYLYSFCRKPNSVESGWIESELQRHLHVFRFKDAVGGVIR